MSLTSKTKKRKVLTDEQVNEKLNNLKNQIADCCSLVKEKIRQFEEFILTHKVLFGYSPSSISDDLINFTNLNLDKKMLDKLCFINTFDEHGNLREKCMGAYGAAHNQNKELEELYWRLYDLFKENKVMLFPSIKNGYLVQLRQKTKPSLWNSNWLLDGNLEQDCLAHELGVVFNKPNYEKPPIYQAQVSDQDYDPDYIGKWYKAHMAIMRKNHELRNKALEEYRRAISGILVGVSPKITKDFYVYEWKLEEGKVMQYFAARHKKVKNDLKIKGNAKNSWLDGRMFFMSGILICWSLDKKDGKIKPSVIPRGNPTWPIALVDLLTNKVLKQA